MKKSERRTLNERAEEYRLPQQTTPEGLEVRWSKVLTYGNKVLLAGHFYQGMGKPSFFGAVYEFTTDDKSCEGQIELKAISEEFFEDDGHAMAWAMNA